MSVCCVLSGRGLCVGLITGPEESYRVWCVWVWSWSLEKWGGLGPQWGCWAIEKKILSAWRYPSRCVYIITYITLCIPSDTICILYWTHHHELQVDAIYIFCFTLFARSLKILCFYLDFKSFFYKINTWW
jgi:hypothetical protein